MLDTSKQPYDQRTNKVFNNVSSVFIREVVAFLKGCLNQLLLIQAQVIDGRYPVWRQKFLCRVSKQWLLTPPLFSTNYVHLLRSRKHHSIGLYSGRLGSGPLGLGCGASARTTPPRAKITRPKQLARMVSGLLLPIAPPDWRNVSFSRMPWEAVVSAKM